MLWHITKREILDHISSLRFALTLALVLMLFIMNALVFINSYEWRLKDYSKEVNKQLQMFREASSSLSALIFLRKEGSLYKSPGHLAFCAEGQEKNLPKRVELRSESGGVTGAMNYSYYTPWYIEYPYEKYRRNLKLQRFVELDWSFIIGVVMSFVAVLFTFDAISGEREHGTLRLVLSNSIPRNIVLLGKYLGASVSLGIPLILGFLLNLLIVNMDKSILMSDSDWLKIGTMVTISFIYLSLFIWLGLLVSSRMPGSSMSLIILLLIWVILVVIIPSSIGTLTGRESQLPKLTAVSARIDAIADEIQQRYERHGLMEDSPKKAYPPTAATLRWANYLKERYDTEAQIKAEYLSHQFAQVRRIRAIARISPTAVYQYALESLAGTGFTHHEQFIAQVRRYREEFLEFIKSEDRKDSNSLHIYFLPETVSDKPVNFQKVPQFAEQYSFETAFQKSFWDMGLLVGLNVLLFLAAVIAFLQADVR